MPATLSLQRSRAVRISTGILRPSRRQLLEHADAVHLRQADIEDHRVIGLGIAEKMPFLAVEGLVDDIAGIGQRLDDLAVQVLVILDDEYPHGITILLPETGSAIGEIRVDRKAARSVCRNDNFNLAATLPVLRRHENHDDTTFIRLRGIRQLPALLGRDLLANGIAICRRDRHALRTKQRRRAKRGDGCSSCLRLGFSYCWCG